MAGGWGDGDAAEPYVQRVAAFAVHERQRTQGGSIQLVAIAWVQQQVVAGMSYRLGLEVSVDGAVHQVTAQVWSQAWRNFLELSDWTTGFSRHPV
jgi:hypothetical protein